jgi:drug/metabolite transporter (DMT)-like permease
MSWLVYAFSGPVLWAISTHLDKYLVERYFKRSDVAVLLVFTAFIGVLMLPFIALYQPTIFSPRLGGIALIVMSGILYMGAMLFYLRALQGEEASVVAPFFQASPLFAYVLAYVVLGETLSGRQLMGGALIVVGALTVSVRLVPAPSLASSASGRREGSGFKVRLAALMLACGFALAVSSLIFKAFALTIDFWTTTFWLFVGQAIFGAALLAVPSYRRQLAAVVRANTAALLTINGSNELINLGGSLGNRYAMMFAPLSVVQAIGSTTTLFVFAFGVLITVFFPRFSREQLSLGDLVQKGSAALLVAAGVVLVTP